MKRAWIFAAVVLLAACSSTPLKQVSFAPPVGASKKQVEVCILNAVSAPPTESRGGDWYFDGTAPGIVYAKFNYKAYKMRVAVGYAGERITMDIIENHGLSNNDRSINKQGYVWLNSLEAKIKRSFGEFAKERATSGTN